MTTEKRTGSAEIVSIVRWTKNPPKMPGYYWAREEGDNGTAHIVELGFDGDAWHFGTEDPSSSEDHARRRIEFWPVRLEPPG